VFHGSSTVILAIMNAFQEYALDGRSRTSYRERCVTKCGMICCTSCPKMVKSMKIENIWFWSSCWLVPALKNEKPMKSAYTYTLAYIRM
jgi:hypothetical protein